MLATRTRMKIDQITQWLKKYQRKLKANKTTRKYLRFSPKEQKILKSHFAENAYPTNDDIDEILLVMGHSSTSKKRIQIWFCSTRCKDKKLNNKMF